LEKLLRDAGYSLSHFNLPIPNDIGTASTENRLLLDKLSYDSSILSSSMEIDIPRLNNCQKMLSMQLSVLLWKRKVKPFLFTGTEELVRPFYGQPY
jgi:hypothetical protein